MASSIPIVLWPFIVFFLFWVVTWPTAKRTLKKQSYSEWFSYWIFIFIGAVLIFVTATVPAFQSLPVLGIPLIHASFASKSFGFLVEILGLCFAIWARITLGRNWSSTVTFKKNHELVTRGPYRFVRHPIYTGMIALFLGMVIYLGFLASFLGILFIFLSFWIKSRQEERLMTEHFPKEYGKYKKTAKALIPFIY